MFSIGIHLEKEAFRVAILKNEKKTTTIVDLQIFPYGPDNVKLFYNLPPFHTGKSVQIVSGLSGSETFIRKLHLPLREKRKILSALPFQLETLIPFPAENILICPLLKPISKKMTSVTVLATVRDHLFAHLDSLKNLDIKPDIVSCHAIALTRFAHWQFPKEVRILSFHSSQQKVSCVVSEKNELILSQTFLVAENEDISLEIEKLSIFLKQKNVIDETTPWLLSGDTKLQDILCDYFPGPQLKIEDMTLSAFAIPVGLALDGLLSDENSVQFCQQEFTPEHTHRFRKKKMLAYLGICLTATLTMFAAGSLMLRKKQHLLTETLQSYLPSTLNKGPLSGTEDIQDKLFEWETSLNRQKMPFPFLPTVPKVSDVLAWLSVNPAFSNEDGAKKEGMEIKSLHYSLIKYPKIGEPAAPYLAQVDVEFTSLTPRVARDFHEALLKGDQIVNAKKEIKWQTQNQTYYVSFELNRGIL